MPPNVLQLDGGTPKEEGQGQDGVIYDSELTSDEESEVDSGETGEVTEEEEEPEFPDGDPDGGD